MKDVENVFVKLFKDIFVMFKLFDDREILKRLWSVHSFSRLLTKEIL